MRKRLWLPLLLTVVSLQSCAGSTADDSGAPGQAAGTPEVLEPISVLGVERPDAGEGLLHRPIGLAIHGEQVFVLDAGDYRIAVFSLDGRYTRSIGRAGSGPGELGNLGFDGRLELGPDRLFVLDIPQRRLQAFTAAGQHVGNSELTRLPASVSVVAGAGFATFKTPPLVGADNAVIHEFDQNWQPRRSFGERLLTLPSEVPDRDMEIRLVGLTHSRVAALDATTVVEAVESWPVVRVYREGTQRDERWLSFGALGELGELLAKPESWVADLRAGRVPDTKALFVPVFLDLKAARSARIVAALLNGGALQILDEEARPIAAFKLGGAADVGREWPNLRALAIDDDGQTVCASSAQDSLVYCYRLPDGLNLNAKAVVGT